MSEPAAPSRWFRRLRRSGGPPPLDFSGCTDRELGLAWARSCARLPGIGAPEWLELTRLRAAYLDELERRDPDAVRVWMEVAMRGEGSRPDVFLPGHREPTG